MPQKSYKYRGKINEINSTYFFLEIGYLSNKKKIQLLVKV